MNYSSNIDHVTKSNSNGDLLDTDEVRCRYGFGRVVTSGSVPCYWFGHEYQSRFHLTYSTSSFDNKLNHKVAWSFVIPNLTDSNSHSSAPQFSSNLEFSSGKSLNLEGSKICRLGKA